MKRFFCLLMSLMCLCLPAAHATGVDAENYTVAGKLVKQLWAGSGFSATVSVEIAAREGTQAMSTLKPIVMDLSYIYVRPTATETAEHRADVVLLDGESAVSAAHAQLKDGALAVQADVISPDWYSFGEAPAQSGETAGNGDVLGKLGESLLAQTGMPALASLAAQAAGLIQGADGLEDVLESYLTRMDLWIEGYRQNAVLGKLPDGTTTMSVYYDVPPAAIKSQAKQMVLDLLSDQVTLARLQEVAGEEMSQLLLNPNLQSYYFSAIDALPLASNLTIDRTVSLEGDTLEIRDGMTYLNGQALQEEYVTHPAQEDFGSVTVEPGHVFVLGDNRANSHDSRTEGTLTESSIVGRAVCVLFPFDQIKTLNAPQE